MSEDEQFEVLYFAYFKSSQHCIEGITIGQIREVSFFYREGGSRKLGDQVLFLDQKGGSKDLYKLKRGITYIF